MTHTSAQQTTTEYPDRTVRNACGLTLSVYRDPASDVDATNGGITSRATRLTLVGYYDDSEPHPEPHVIPLPEHSQVFAPTEEAPAVVLRLRRIGGPVLDLVPARWDPLPRKYVAVEGWFMSGGNYAATTDSRLSELARDLTGRPFYGALAVHDRKEW